jgi:hypothetical protein
MTNIGSILVKPKLTQQKMDVVMTVINANTYLLKNIRKSSNQPNQNSKIGMGKRFNIIQPFT